LAEDGVAAASVAVAANAMAINFIILFLLRLLEALQATDTIRTETTLNRSDRRC
jgi:hypothetical protein